MLDNINLDKVMVKEEYKKFLEEYEIKLGILQREARELNIPIILVYEGWDAAGKGTLINNLIICLDPRGFNVFTISEPTEEEQFKPYFWRFWNKTPAKGRIALFDKSWYQAIPKSKIGKKEKELTHLKTYDEIKEFEQQLSLDGTMIIKFFLHITKKEQKKRFDKLESKKSTSWRITKLDWKHHKLYEEYQAVYNEMLEKTDTDYAPWTIIEATDERFATIKMMQTVINRIEGKIKQQKSSTKEKKSKSIIQLDNIQTSILDTIDLSKSLQKEEYEKKLDEYQERIRELQFKIYKKRIPVLIQYEGWDAAGKGGNIKRLTQNLDPRGYEVVPISAPNDIEKAHHYLWRFWNKIPKGGHISIFDRTWYGRVLVERVEGFCSENDWKRAYKEINETEAQLVNFGVVIIKFWLQIDKEEQLKRFNERQNTPYKQWKITEDDWRNREKWDFYKAAIDEMLYRTHTTFAPWTVIESNDKYYARIKALKTVIEAIEKKINY